MIRVYYFILLLSFSGSLLSGAVSAQLSVPRVEQAVQMEDENPNDTVRVFDGTLGLNLSQTALEN
jgi:hypothetical protein